MDTTKLLEQALKELELEDTIIIKKSQVDAIQSKIQEISDRDAKHIDALNSDYGTNANASNKQQLIDKAIDFLEGNFPKLRICDYFTLDDALYLGRYNRPPVAVCNRQEFEARKAERESISHWYNYENQKALRLPPVGEIVLVIMNGSDCKAKVLEVTKNDCENLIVCRVISLLDSGIGELKYFSTAKPLDWKSKSKSELHELGEIIMEEMDCCAGMDRAAKAILAAGYRKCHNKTPPDKE